MAKKLMFLGTGSDVGKSVTTTAFCRILKNKGLSVAPFKAQNMSNNSYVTIEGGEIGRAQVAQAQACGLLPSVLMNPVLLKPLSDMGSQVVLLGKVLDNMPARNYYELKSKLKSMVIDSFHQLETTCDAIVLEGAGSCCEVNLRQHDIVNFEMAQSVDAPVVLIADIDRGGVFAQIVGSLEVISPAERDLIAGFIINKFRGDPALFKDGIDYLEKRTQKPVFGLVPVFEDIYIDSEDSMSLDAYSHIAADTRTKKQRSSDSIDIAVIRLPHISNFTDIEVLAREKKVNVTWIRTPDELAGFDAIIIPGSKNVIADMTHLTRKGFVEGLHNFIKNSPGVIVGLCGGYQMLGNQISDPFQIEGTTESIPGFGLLDTTTTIEKTKMVVLTEGMDCIFQTPVRGYEIHMGQTELGRQARPFLKRNASQTAVDGAISLDERVFGTYLHGLFDSGRFRQKFIQRLAVNKGIILDDTHVSQDYWTIKEEHYDKLAAHFEKYTDVEAIIECMH